MGPRISGSARHLTTAKSGKPADPSQTLYSVQNYQYFWGDFPPNLIVPTVGRGRHNSPHSLQCPYALTTIFQSSFVPSSITLWNSLPIEALSANSVQSFKFTSIYVVIYVVIYVELFVHLFTCIFVRFMLGYTLGISSLSYIVYPLLFA